MESDELSSYLDALARDDCYRVERVLKRSDHETTEVVRFVDGAGGESSPRIRKRIARGSGLGRAYADLYNAQRSGKRFRYLPHLFDCYAAGDETVIIMEFVHGRTLADVVYERDPSLDLAESLFPQICDAVSELHEGFPSPIIHRDLKPSNIIVGESGPTIIDLGIARTYRADAETDTARFGTRAYAPPEQFGYGQTDVRSDVYALGMILYYCLTEKTPAPASRDAMLADPAIPREVAEVIDRATAFDPAARYVSARAARDAFLQAARQVKRRQTASVPSSKRGDAVRCDNSSGFARPGSAADATKGSGSSRVATVVGAIWDVIVLLAWAIVVAASVYVTACPTGDIAAWPLEQRVVAYYGFLIPLATCFAYIVLARRPLLFVPGLRLIGPRRKGVAIAVLAAVSAASMLALVALQTS